MPILGNRIYKQTTHKYLTSIQRDFHDNWLLDERVTIIWISLSLLDKPLEPTARLLLELLDDR